jgi:hypothetical protein
VAAAAGAGQNTRGAVEVAGQAVPLRQAGGGHIGGAEHKQQAGRLHPWIYLAVIEYCSRIMIEWNKVKGYLTAF